MKESDRPVSLIEYRRTKLVVEKYKLLTRLRQVETELGLLDLTPEPVTQLLPLSKPSLKLVPYDGNMS